MKEIILIVAEQRDGVLQPISFELLGIAAELKKLGGDRVYALLMGDKLGKMPQTLVEFGADEVIAVEHANLKNYLTEPYAYCVAEAARKYKPSVVLIGATSMGRDFAPRVSARLGTGLTADCTKLEMAADGLRMTRPAFGGNLFATILCPEHRPQMATVRPGVMKKNAPDKSRAGEIVFEKWNPPLGSVKLLEEKQEERKCDNIEDAKLLVSVGRGVGTYLDKVKELAADMKATLSSSRAMVDAGFTAPDRQVGQTGKTVRPECYLALGISGAVQHLAGMEESDYIIAVNRDRGAAIFNVADLGIVGDVKQIVPLLREEVAKAKRE